jgi:hypothetical protein
MPVVATAKKSNMYVYISPSEVYIAPSETIVASEPWDKEHSLRMVQDKDQ